jgi:hypothetical protein
MIGGLCSLATKITLSRVVAMLKTGTTTVDLDALTAYVVANPDDYTGWSAYSDLCRDLANDAWADLALKFRGADDPGRSRIFRSEWRTWPPMKAFLAITFEKTRSGIRRPADMRSP